MDFIRFSMLVYENLHFFIDLNDLCGDLWPFKPGHIDFILVLANLSFFGWFISGLFKINVDIITK